MPDIDILKSLNCSRTVIEHCIAVSENSIAIAGRVKPKTDKELIMRGAMLHDIGRCKTHGIFHGIEGAKIIREFGLGEKIAKIAERHIGAGITRDEAEKIGFPPGDFCPKSIEEKIVAYADNLTKGANAISFEESIAKFKKILGKNHPSINRMEELHREIQSWIRG